MKYKIKVYQFMDPGKRIDQGGRPHQEDSMFPAYQEASAANDRLFILCDGMGGHEAGEVASATVCKAMSDTILGMAPAAEGSFDNSIFERALNNAFNALDAMDDGSPKKMGTTMTMLKLHRDGATIAHMGDSRVYHIRPGRYAHDTKILYRTSDHSLVNELLKANEITAEEAANYPAKNIITRALQPNLEQRPKATLQNIKDIRPGDYFYLCTDGMLENMDDHEVCYQFSDSAGDDMQKLSNLIDATRYNNDNHSYIIVHVMDVIPEPVLQAQQPNISAAPRSMNASPISARRAGNAPSQGKQIINNASKQIKRTINNIQKARIIQAKREQVAEEQKNRMMMVCVGGFIMGLFIIGVLFALFSK